MRRLGLTGLAALGMMAMGSAAATALDDNAPARETVTFAKDILPILQQNCQVCHRPAGENMAGMIAPMPLMTYREVRPWAKSIAQQVQARTMPPWFASKEFHGIFANERTLTDAEVDRFVRWVAAGAPEGNPADAPAPVSWNTTEEGWSIGTPDLIVSLAEPFWVKDGVEDLNISLKAEPITVEMLPEPRYIAAVEFKPGSEVVHHIIGSRRHGDAEEPGAEGMIGGMAPGTDPFILPEGYGRLLLPGTQMYFQMHYHKEPGPGTGVWDHSQMAFKFHPKDQPIKRNVEWSPVGNRDFEIPPTHGNWMVGAARVFPHDTTIFALLPHAHLRGKAARYVAFYPNGRVETLLDVPRYDFNWQTNYTYREPKRIPAGTRIEVTMWFDNSETRGAYVPNINIHEPVRFGGPTTAEMMLGWIDYAEEVDVNHAALP